MSGRQSADRVILVHSLDHAVAALKASASLGVPVILSSAPGAAGFGGPLWFQSLLEQAGAAVPEARFEGLLDCGDQAGRALQALRQGSSLLRFTGPKAILAKLQDMAEQCGARVITGPIGVLDLLYERDPQRACRHWLEVRLKQ